MQLTSLNCEKLRVMFVRGLPCDAFWSREIRLETQLPPHLEERVWAETRGIGGREQKFLKMSELKNKGHTTKNVKSKTEKEYLGHSPLLPQIPIHLPCVKGKKEELWDELGAAASPAMWCSIQLLDDSMN